MVVGLRSRDQEEVRWSKGLGKKERGKEGENGIGKWDRDADNEYSICMAKVGGSRRKKLYGLVVGVLFSM